MERQRMGSKSPIHVHATRDTPVHVHVKKKKKKTTPREIPGIPTAVGSRLSQRHSSGIGSSMSAEKHQSNPRLKSKPRATPTFIPPPGRTSSGKSMSWEGPHHRLEINQPSFSPKKNRSLRVSDLSTSEDENTPYKETMYEEKINSLMDEVGVLRNELSLQKTARDLEKRDEQLNASRRVLEEQEDELLGYKSELDTTIRENEKLRQSMEKYKNVMEQSRSEVENIETEKEVLLRKLVEVEKDGRAAAEEVGKLRDTVRRLKHDKKLTATDVSTLSHQREVLMQKLEGFETTNRTLRKLLKQAHLNEGEVNHISEQRDVLLKKLTEADSRIEVLIADVTDKDRQVETLVAQVEGDKQQARMFEELHKTMETTRAHLQNQLRTKEGENFRISNRLREAEQELNRRIVEVEHLEGLLNSTREKAANDKEALKKATRMHRDRAYKSEEAVNAIRVNLASKTEEVEALLAEMDAYKEKYNKSFREKASLDVELVETKGQLQDIEEIMASLDLGGLRVSNETLPTKLRTKMQELKSYRIENESLKEEVVALSEKLSTLERSSAAKIGASHADMTRLQSAVDQYENIISEFKGQIDRYRKEIDDLNERLYQKEKEMKKQLHQSATENEQAINTLERKVSELEVYPDLLKASEVRLRDAQDCVTTYEKRATEHTKLIAELTQKVDTQAEQLERVREKYQGRQDEIKQLQVRLDSTERKFEDSESFRKEISDTVNKREESIHILQERLDEQRHENTRLVQQLEAALADAKRQADIQREKTMSKERTAQARILDLESQLSRSASTAQQLKRAKEEAEHKFNSRLQDMRDRLEQANSSTRSMQNYVSFLKTTYASVFSDSHDSALSSPKLY